MDIQRLDKIFHTVRYMTPRQWFYRGFYALTAPIPRRAEAKSCRECTPLPLGFAGTDASLETARGILKLEFPLVSGFTVRFQGAPDWDLPGNDYRLQCFRLNSFDFLHTLSGAFRQTGESAFLDRGLSLMAHWQANCRRVTGDKWNAYVTAQRLTNWIGFVSTHFPEKASDAAGWVEAQARVLARSVEYQLGGNHLLTEGKALMYAGAFLKDDKLYRRGKKLLDREFSRQFPADGGHYEGSVSYHVESMQQYLESALLMGFLNDPDWAPFAARLKKPYDYLSGMIGAAGVIPLFNDSAFDYCAQARDFLATSALLFETAAPGSREGSCCRRYAPLPRRLEAQWLPPSTRLYESTGIFVDRFPGHSFFLRCGDIGPDSNPGHGHGDYLNLLWQTDEGEVFADSGVFTYQPGPLRDACRATSAHNTLEIDGRSSAQVWGAFRVARRGHGRVTRRWKNGITAEHDGYRKTLGVLHSRTYRRDREEVVVIDRLDAAKGCHTAALRFHLAPGCPAEQLDAHRVRLMGRYLLRCSRPVTLEPCAIAGDFGMLRESLCITARWSFTGLCQVQTTIQLKIDTR